MIQPLEGSRPWAPLLICSLIDQSFKRLDESQKRVWTRPSGPRKRHHTCPQLHNHLLRRLCQLRGFSNIKLRQREVTPQRHIIMAPDTVLLDNIVEFIRRHYEWREPGASRLKPLKTHTRPSRQVLLDQDSRRPFGTKVTPLRYSYRWHTQAKAQ